MKNNPLIWLSYVSFPITTAVYFEKALRKKYKVITCGPNLPENAIKLWQLEDIKEPFKNHDVPTNFGVLDFRQMLHAVPGNARPDFFLWIESAAGYFPLDISGNGFPTACYLIDTHLSLENHIKWARNFDFTFIAQREYILDFKKAGIENVFWLPLGADPEVHSKRNTGKLYDVGFVGSVNTDLHQRRAGLLNKIDAFVKVNYKRCWLDEMAEFFSASKIVFNNAIRNDLNMRLFEAMSIGSFLLTDTAKNSGQEEMFKDGEDLGIYTDDNIVEKVKYYLSHNGEREKIAAHGREIIHNAHTYFHRAEEILKVCSGERKDTPSAGEWRSRSLGKTVVQVKRDLTASRNGSFERSFVIPVLDMSPASPYNIVKLLEDLKDIPGEVIIIFNSLEMLERLKDNPRINNYAAMKKNVGVSRAWNIGLNMSQSPVTFILNSDLHLGKETVENMEKYLLGLPDAAMVGPQGSFFNFENAKDMAYFEKGSFSRPIEVDAVSGFLFAVKTELFNSGVVKFDNQYTPCYFEEWDMGLQIRQQNMKSYAVPVNGFEHEWSGSIRALRKISYLDKEETSGEILERNRKLFWNKWKGISLLEEEDSVLLKSGMYEVLSSLTEELAGENRIDEAEKLLRILLANYPDDKPALARLGELLYKAGKNERALEVLERLQAVDPDFKIGKRNLPPGSYQTPGAYTTGLMKKKEEDYYGNSRPDIQQIVSPGVHRILDVGCGAGVMASELKEKLNAEVWGIEINKDAAALAEVKIDEVIYGKVEKAIDKLPGGYFDTIIFADVLEHLVDPYSVLEKIKGKLSTVGEIIASIPNVRHWTVIKQLLEGRWDYRDFGIMDSTHLRFFTRSSIFDMFDKAGFKIKEILYVVAEAGGPTPTMISAMRESNLNVETLEGESKHFQYIVKASVK